jgi:transcriptional regulator with XRE-family HTH domain
MKGQTLRLSRLRLGLRQQDVAEVVGFSRARIGQIEQLRKVPPVWVDRYRGALRGIQSTSRDGGTAGANEAPPAV